MKDKDIKDLVDKLDHIDKLDLDFNQLGEEADLDDDDINKIKEKTYEKIGTSKIRKYRNIRLRSLLASIALVVFIGGTVVGAFVNTTQKYDPSTGDVYKSELPILLLKEPITKKVFDGEITLEKFLIDTGDEVISTEAKFVDIENYGYIKHELKVNGKNIVSEDFKKEEKREEGMANYWFDGVFELYKYSPNDKYEYSIIFKDKNEKITTVKFQVEIVNATTIEEYNEYLPKDTKNNVTLSAIAKEKDDILYIDFLATASEENMDFTVGSYGDHMASENRSGITLTDAKGQEVDLQPLEEDMINNKFKVDVKNLEKPYTLEINQIAVYAESEKYVEVQLPSLELNKRKKLDKVVDIADENNILTKESSKVLIKTVKREQNDDGQETFSMNLDYPDNENSSIKLRSLDIEHVKVPKSSFIDIIKSFALGNEIGMIHEITSSQTCSMEDGIARDTQVYFKKSNKKYRQESFKIRGSEYLMQGSWKIKIE